MRFGSRLFLAWMIVALLVALPGSVYRTQAESSMQQRQVDVAQQKAQAMLSRLTPEERVGQLFLVTFRGSNFDENSQIFDLLTYHHVGGVVLLRANDNFSGVEDVSSQVYQLNRLLQETKRRASLRTMINPTTALAFSPQYIPLLIGTIQEGDHFPNDQILSGLTPLPDLMAIGATWDPTLSHQVGLVMGKELSALGFNLYLGPSLDVLDVPQADNGEDLGVRAFGGDPYWVGKMGQAYVSGLHKGSGSRLLVVAKHFPGRGGSDRSPEEEIATVRKSLDQLQQIELSPFFSVTGSAQNEEMMVDGLLVSHIRYQGFQGNIRSTTRPVSSDAGALDLILQRPAFTTWRQTGGLIISDNLGSQAIRRFYDPTGSSFVAQVAARDAFIAGNDLLFVDRFVSSQDPDSYTTIVKTLEFFAQKYREDDAFAQRVDSSVERILTTKFRLYPEFTTENVLRDADILEGLGASTQVTFDVARRAATLISPDAAELQSILPRPPDTRERIVFLTDVQPGRQCTTCSDQVTLAVDTLQSAVLRLYGPRAGGLVSQNLMSSYAFMDLYRYLNNAYTETPPIEGDLRSADWVVVSLLKPNPNLPESMAFRRLLNERPDLLRNKRIIVFAFNAPYYLDATDISKLTAYYAMYSKTAPFVDAAARILFQELPLSGSLPVSVPGVGYDLFQATRPDPDQVIPLIFDLPRSTGPNSSETQEPTPAPLFRVDDLIPLRTGVIYDQNQNPVPDGTPVRFVFRVRSESGSTMLQHETLTYDGVARTSYRIERPGILDIHAATEHGAQSSMLSLDTLTGGITQVAPTVLPTETPTPTTTPTATQTVTPTATPEPIPANIGVTDWFYVLIMVVAGALAVSFFGIRLAIARWGLRWALCGLIGGLISYNYIALGLPGSQDLLEDAGTRGVLVVTLAGILLGWIIGWLWRLFSMPPGRASGERVTGPGSQSS
jgi:beta-N-acetylhexosaminidase